MAESMKSGLSNAMSAVGDLMSGDMDMQPTIRPVLDLSNLTGAANELDSLFYPQKTMNLVGQASLSFRSAEDRGQSTLTVDNSDVVEELRSLRSDMAAMSDRMKRMQIVLDTGALVGEMTAPMDAALGQRSIYKGRGI